jgi:hypothetical protein
MIGRDTACKAISPTPSMTADSGNGMNSVAPPNTSTLLPAPRPGFMIDHETLNQLPDLEKLAAISAINRGFWRLVGNNCGAQI